MERFTEALIFAAEAHDGQPYGDRPHIFHPVQVAEALRMAGATEDEVIAGLLHDTVEDCPHVSLVMVETKFGFNVAAIVAGLTHDDGDSYEDYMAQMPEASKRVKFFDSLCNFIGLQDFRSAMTPERRSKLMVRYSKNLVDLLPAVSDMNLEPVTVMLIQEIGAAYNEVAPT